MGRILITITIIKLIIAGQRMVAFGEMAEDKKLHMAGSAVLFVVGDQAMKAWKPEMEPWKRKAWVGGGVFAAGLLKEWVWEEFKEVPADEKDVMYNAAGIGVGLAITIPIDFLGGG